MVDLERGLVAREPGPTDCENFGRGIGGASSGLKLGFSMVDRLKLWYEGVVGVRGKSDESADTRFCAR